jgi:exodeoxyribonuclease V beta subunit
MDEFQDTSLLQYKILKPLIDEVIAGDSEKFKTFFYVGDTKQSHL